MDKCKDCYNMDCIFISETNGCDAVETCDDFKPMTNADRIRAMSDEELAEWIVIRRTICPTDTYACSEVVSIKRCIRCWLDWLHREAKESE